MNEGTELSALERHQAMIPQRVLGEIDAYCYMVQRGKPAALLAVGQNCAEHVREYVKEAYDLQIFIDNLSDGWVQVWIYQHSHIREVIQALPRVPQTAVDHWMLGKLLGYDEPAIAAFLGHQ